MISDHQHVFLSKGSFSALVLISLATVRGGHVQQPHPCKRQRHFSVVDRSNGNLSARQSWVDANSMTMSGILVEEIELQPGMSAIQASFRKRNPPISINDVTRRQQDYLDFYTQIKGLTGSCIH